VYHLSVIVDGEPTSRPKIGNKNTQVTNEVSLLEDFLSEFLFWEGFGVAADEVLLGDDRHQQDFPEDGAIPWSLDDDFEVPAFLGNRYLVGVIPIAFEEIDEGWVQVGAMLQEESFLFCSERKACKALQVEIQTISETVWKLCPTTVDEFVLHVQMGK
jgi:hypothetical protein